MHYLYIHKRLDNNEPFYIGVGTVCRKHLNSIKTTYYQRAYAKGNRNKRWVNIVNKYNYKVEILLESNDYSFIKEEEIRHIKLYGKLNNGGLLCNITDGGDGVLGNKFWKGRNHKESTKNKISQSKLGAKNPMFGKRFTEAHKENHRKGLIGHVVSEETRTKISKAQGRKVIDIRTGEVFDTIGEAAQSLKMKTKTLNAKLTGQIINNTTLTYLKKS